MSVTNAESLPNSATDEERAAYEETKDLTPHPDPSQVEAQDVQADPSRSLVTVIARTPEAIGFTRHQQDIGSHAWGRLCLALQRAARNAPPLAATAIAAQHMTPAEFRVAFDKAIRGMIGYSFNPDNPGSGHVFQLLGYNANELMLTRTNDAHVSGAVSVVDLGFYARNWGHELQFAATWVNGFPFPDFVQEPPKPMDHAHLGNTYQNAIDSLKEAIKFHEGSKRPGTGKLLRVLHHELGHLEETKRQFS